jgi:hypothetical protein
MRLSGDPAPNLFSETHPAWCAGYGQEGAWRAIGASVIGRGHLRRFRPRDDAFLIASSGALLVAAVADGVSGELYSRLGAAHCVHAVCQEIIARVSRPHVRRPGIDDFDPATLPRELTALGITRETPRLQEIAPAATTPAHWESSGTLQWHWRPYRFPLPTDLDEEDDPLLPPPSLLHSVQEAFAAAHSSHAQFAGQLRCKPAKFACTLLVAAVDLATNSSVVGQLGDGAILNLDTLIPVLPTPARTVDDNPFTIDLDGWRNGFHVAEAEAPGWLMLTDGAVDFLPEIGAVCRELLGTAQDGAMNSLHLLDWLQRQAKDDCHDDRTAVFLTGRRLLDRTE